jgi:outer membrane receptor protein involved in Fe transport
MIGREAGPRERSSVILQRLVAPGVALMLAGTITGAAGAQASCSVAPAPAVRVVARRWPAPLDRPVTLQGDNVTLRDGLARLANAAHVRLSYVAELLPLDRSMCLAYRGVAAGDVLADLLRGTQLEPVVAGDDQVVLAPARRTALTVPEAEDPDLARTSVLDRVVVMGSASPITDRASPIATDVISGERLARQQTGSLSQILNGSVPGMWMWQSAPSTLLARYGSVRGASSFGVSFPKMYIDGIEVANPLLVRQFDPSTIERLEVIRGPQGSALYGADANSGVINIITRHDGIGPTGHRLELASTAGMSGSQFAAAGVMTQQHALSLRTGTTERSAGIGLSMGTLGAYVPGAFARSFSATGDVRRMGERSVFTGSARLFSERAGTPLNPLLPQVTAVPGPGTFPRVHDGADKSAYTRSGPDGARTSPMTTSFGPLVGVDTTATQSVREYTIGETLAYAPGERWTHTFVLGVDGYRLSNPAVENGPIPSASDSALAAARGGSDRVTARVSSEAHFAWTNRAATDVKLMAEHSTAREQSPIAIAPVGQRLNTIGSAAAGGAVGTEAARLIGWRGNSGLVAQSSTSFHDRLFLTAGLRLERNDALLGSTRVSTLPMLGVAVVGDRGDVSLKVRTAYGKGIRPVQGVIRELSMSGRRNTLVAYDLTPERQAGVEAGADLFVGRNLAFHVTRFDQRATGLIQSVAVEMRTRSTARGVRFDDSFSDGYVAYQLQNVGEISNRGWELQSSADFGRLALSGTLALVDSRVQRLASGYSGDLRTGDRMFEVPSRTMSINGSWTGRGWLSSLTLARAADWMGYDRVAVAAALTSGGLTPSDLVGEQLRGYWRQYDGVTRLGASFSRDLFRGLSFVLTGDNLLGQQRGEPDNATVVPGRTVTAGLKAKF